MALQYALSDVAKLAPTGIFSILAPSRAHPRTGSDSFDSTAFNSQTPLIPCLQLTPFTAVDIAVDIAIGIVVGVVVGIVLYGSFLGIAEKVINRVINRVIDTFINRVINRAI